MYPGSTTPPRRSAPPVPRLPRATAWEIVCQAIGLVVLVMAGALTASAQTLPQASAPQFNITPTRVFIPAGQTSASLMLRNEGPEPLRFQISASAWSNDADGQLVLQPTTDVVFFPV